LVDYQQSPSQGSPQEEGEGEGFDWEKFAGYGRFLLGSLGRRKFLFFFVLASMGGLVYLAYWLMPRSYHVEVQLLAQRNQAIGNLAIGGRSMPDVAPTRAAAETVLRRDNLVALVQQAELVPNWDLNRSRIARLKDWVRAKMGRFTPDEEKVEIILGTLENSLSVTTKPDYSGEGIVSIAIDWPDPKMGYRLVTAAQQSFIEARHLSEVSSITEALSILVARATSLRKEIDSTVRAIEDRRAEKGERRRALIIAAGERRAAVRAASPAAAAAEAIPASEREAVELLQAQWEAKKSALRDLEDMRRRRITELQTKLAELRATYAESHPAVVDTQQTIQTLEQESPQQVQLKREEAALRAQIQARTAKSGPTAGEILATPMVRDTAVLRATAEPSSTDDREMEFAKSQLRFQAGTYDRVLERLEAARMELETARAAFKYRFVVIHPAQVPRDPDKPKPAKILGGGMVAALLLALVAAIGADLRSGRVYAPWQLERALRLPVLAEIRRDT
jgi:uncharacterized protein involved in exopolysaccharide biosynthesis